MNTRSFRGKGRPMGIEVPAVPGCNLKGLRACSGTNCAGCGWNVDEIEKRKELLRRNGLTVDPKTGLKRLVVTRGTA